MAWNPSPEVAVARDAAKRLGTIHGSQVTQIVVIYVTKNEQVGMATYGHNAAQCNSAKGWGEKLWQQTQEYFEDYAT